LIMLMIELEVPPPLPMFCFSSLPLTYKLCFYAFQYINLNIQAYNGNIANRV
jgi:hypothetical protein